ncbi:FAD-dependent oxidoreductase [Wenzhouxiangella marina]|uniref:FAD dependent oxidoreductase domain-containing protein n=1 Tax=Wenzhouxiangella marina TaxID=1579979 RepID=A0A0K0XYC1_9GAMM|nr:FAD-dependent oxidoreductase [Wenzhouxiangella marina]AKS42678.1 hypothetical protein WM2015_2315 [Wenzhouxiangella marina]MBB6088633.1 glycine oxidase [Wenzhouxiangella marina]
MRRQPDLIVVGADASGLLSALALLDVGLMPQVVALRDAPDRLPPIDDSPLPPWFRPPLIEQLEMRAAQLLPELVSRLGQSTGVDLAIARRDLLVEGEADRSAADWLAHTHLHWSTGPIADVDSHLAQGSLTAVCVHQRLVLRQDRLERALRAELQQRGVELVSEAAVRRLDVAGNIVLGVELDDGRWLGADAVLVAAGAAGSRLIHDSGLERLEGEAAFAPGLLFAPSSTSLAASVWMDEFWLSPRLDGRLLAGTAIEADGQPRLDSRALRERVHARLPGLGRHDLQLRGETLALSANARAAIGAYPGVRGLWINAGHEAFGPILAIAAAEFLAEQLDGAAPVRELAVRLAPR